MNNKSMAGDESVAVYFRDNRLTFCEKIQRPKSRCPKFIKNGGFLLILVAFFPRGRFSGGYIKSGAIVLVAIVRIRAFCAAETITAIPPHTHRELRLLDQKFKNSSNLVPKKPCDKG